MAEIKPEKVVGALDLTFSAPKGVSVLYALADGRTASELVVAALAPADEPLP